MTWHHSSLKDKKYLVYSKLNCAEKCGYCPFLGEYLLHCDQELHYRLLPTTLFLLLRLSTRYELPVRPAEMETFATPDLNSATFAA
jgi:hypothetical protein